MKKLYYLIVLIVVLGLILVGCGLLTAPPSEESELDKAKPGNCTTIKNGILEYSTGHYLSGEPLIVGYDIFGYNYQAHMFKGYYANAYLGSDGFPPYEGDTEGYLIENSSAESKWYWPYRDTQLVMKWNDAWLSNQDCNADGKLDRHYDYASYIGSGAWETNHQWDTYWLFDNTWELEFILDVEPYGTYPHSWEVTTQTDGTIEGIGKSGIHEYTFVITVNDNSLEFTATYGSTLPGYQYFAEGTIAVDGTINGTWFSTLGEFGTWSSVEGTATLCEWNYFCKIIAVPLDADSVSGTWFDADGVEIGPDIWGQFAVIQEVCNDPCAGDEGILYKSPAGPGFGKYGPE